MGVYIDMEMPKEGYIDVRIKCNGTASFAIAVNPYVKAVEAVPVPPHGDLIDRDALRAEVRKHATPSDAWVFSLIRKAHTVIEAEEGE